jgi:hypothetical protein
LSFEVCPSKHDKVKAQVKTSKYTHTSLHPEQSDDYKLKPGEIAKIVYSFHTPVASLGSFNEDDGQNLKDMAVYLAFSGLGIEDSIGGNA